MQDDRKKSLLILALICVAAIVAYIPAMQAGYIWDDDAYVEENMTLKTVGGILDIWFSPFSIPQYYPLVHTTFWIEYRLWGLHPFGYHFDNVLLHLISTLLLFKVVRKLALPGATLAAGVFALHPVMVESVAWVTERKNVLSMVFYLWTLLVYLRLTGLDASEQSGSEPKQGSAWRKSYWLALGLFLCALASKSVTFSLPFTILLITWWKRARLTKADVLPLIPFILVGIAYGAVTSYIERYHVGAIGAEWSDTTLDKILIAGRVPWFYLSKIAFPYELTFIYDRWEIDSGVAWQYLYPAATVALIAGLAVLAWRKGMRGPLTAILMFGGTLFPALGFVDVFPFRYSYVADHFQYHAALGVIVLATALATRWIPRQVGVPLAVVVLAALGVRTWMQCQKYENKEVLYESVLADDDTSFFAYNNLGAIYIKKNEIDKGYEYYRKTQELRPELAPKASPESYAECMVGTMLAKIHSLAPVKKQIPELRRLHQQSMLAQQAGDRGAFEALRAQHDAMAKEALLRRDQIMPFLEQARKRFEKAHELSPEYVTPLANLGGLMQEIGQVQIEPGKDPMVYLSKTIRAWDKVLQIDPKHKQTRLALHKLHVLLAERLESMRDRERAAVHRREAARIKREDPEPERTWFIVK